MSAKELKIENGTRWRILLWSRGNAVPARKSIAGNTGSSNDTSETFLGAC